MRLLQAECMKCNSTSGTFTDLNGNQFNVIVKGNEITAHRKIESTPDREQCLGISKHNKKGVNQNNTISSEDIHPDMVTQNSNRNNTINTSVPNRKVSEHDLRHQTPILHKSVLKPPFIKTGTPKQIGNSILRRLSLTAGTK